MTKPVNVAVIGCGRIAQAHFDALAAIEDCRLVAVSDSDESVADQTGSRLGVKAFYDFRRLIDEMDVEAVYVCTPPDTHAEISLFALEHGVHVLCEKPFALTTGSADRMVAEALRAGLFITMASKFRFVPDVREARRLIHTGRIGEVVLGEVVFCSPVDMRGRWNAQSQISGGGVVMDNGSHAADIVRYLCGPIVRVSALRAKNTAGLEVEDTAILLGETSTGVLARIDLSWTLDKQEEPYISVYGEEGRMRIGWKQSSYWLRGQPAGVSLGSGYRKLDAFTEQDRHFLACARGTEEPIMGPEDAVASVRVIDAAYRSASEGAWMQVEQG